MAKKRTYSGWRYEGHLRPRTWTVGIKSNPCCDCGEETYRTYNNGHIFQCADCAAAIRAAGSRKELRRQKRVAAQLAAETKRKSQSIQPAEVIPAREPSFEAALNEGVDAATLKALGNQEAMEAALIAYTEKKRELTEELERAA
jgi:hypothetical protein